MGAKGPPDFGHYREATHSHRPGGQKACNIITVTLLCSVVQFNPKTLQCIAVINSTRKLLGLYQYWNVSLTLYFEFVDKCTILLQCGLACDEKGCFYMKMSSDTSHKIFVFASFKYHLLSCLANSSNWYKSIQPPTLRFENAHNWDETQVGIITIIISTFGILKIQCTVSPSPGLLFKH